MTAPELTQDGLTGGGIYSLSHPLDFASFLAAGQLATRQLATRQLAPFSWPPVSWQPS